MGAINGSAGSNRRVSWLCGLVAVLIGVLIGLFLWTATAHAEETDADEPEIAPVQFVDASELREISPAAVGNDVVQLAPGTHERWIDRVIMPQWAHDAYDAIVEGGDGDGYDDFLLHDSTYSTAGSATLDDYYPGAIVRTRGGSYYVVKALDPTEDFQTASDIFYTAVTAYLCDHPEAFWMGQVFATTYATFGSGDRYFLFLLHQDSSGYDLRNSEYRSEYSIRTGTDFMNRRIDEIVGEARSQGVTDYDLIRYFNKWLTQHNDYNSDGPPFYDMAYSCITALDGRYGSSGPVCESYAEAFMMLCRRVNIPCIVVQSLTHEWNMACLNGAWYAVDVTWDDPGGSYTSEEYLLVGAQTVDGQGRTFERSHVMANWSMSDIIAFTNQPPLSEWAFDPAAAKEPSSVIPSQSSVTLKESETVTITIGGEGDGATSATSSDRSVVWATCFGTTLTLTGVNAGHATVTIVREATDAYTQSSGTISVTVEKAVEPEPEPDPEPEPPAVETCNVYRLYNPFTYEHLYTASANERTQLTRSGWSDEGVGWRAPQSTGSWVYRAFNPFSGEHLYTANWNEYDNLVRSGWNGDGPVFHSAEKTDRPIYRLYNPHSDNASAHLFTASAAERTTLLRAGYESEGVGWYGL